MTDVRYTVCSYPVPPPNPPKGGRRIICHPVLTFEEVWMCSREDCQGKMLTTGIMVTSMPPLYQHACSECGRFENSPNAYPCIVHRREDEVGADGH